MRSAVPILGATLLVAAACATTVRDDRPAEPTWRSRSAAAPAAAAPALDGARLAAYVASFGLSARVAERYPELLEVRAGFGISQRIADALYGSGRFRFLEEKAEMAARLADFRARAAEASAPEGSPAEARWLLYGELVDVQVARDERVTGFAGRVEVTTRATVQVRLVDREGGRYLPATATGSSVSPGELEGPDPELDPVALADATGEAVRAAAAELVARLEAR